MSYDKFYRFYDVVMGDRSDAAGYIAGLIAHNKPDTTTVLEIACGTGTIMGFLSASYDVTGLDRSRPMLAVARKKLPHVRFFRQDMTSFRIARRFDAIVCVFDSINHLLRFADWRKVFRRVAWHQRSRVRVGIEHSDHSTQRENKRAGHALGMELCRWHPG